MGRLLRSGEVAGIFSVSRSTVIRWTRHGQLPFRATFGGHHRYDEDEMLALRDGQPMKTLEALKQTLKQTLIHIALEDVDAAVMRTWALGVLREQYPEEFDERA